MLKVGLTGGIGSGKSTVADIFRLLGIPVFVADLQARELLSRDPGVKRSVIQLLGPGAYLESGLPDRSFIADRVFNDPTLLQRLNAIVHPAVRVAFDHWCGDVAAHSYVIQEAAILFESGGAELMDANVVVWAPETLRVQRVMQRDNIPEEDVRGRMAHQLPDDEKAKRADFILINDGAHSLIRQVLEIHHILSGTEQSGTRAEGRDRTGKSLAS